MANRAGVARFGDGQSTLDGRIDQQGGLVTSALHGDHYEQSIRKNVFFSHCQAQATSVIGTGLIGNIVWNPPDSGVNLALLQWNSYVVVTSATTTAIMLATGYQSTVPTGLTGATATGSTFLTQPTLTVGKAKAYSAATVLIAPIHVAMLQHNTAAIAVTGVDVNYGDFDGLWTIPPGGFVCMAAFGAAIAAAGHTSLLTWEEVPTL